MIPLCGLLYLHIGLGVHISMYSVVFANEKLRQNRPSLGALVIVGLMQVIAWPYIILQLHTDNKR